MKWALWIIGVLLYLALRNPHGNDSPDMQSAQFIVLTVFSILGYLVGKGEARREKELRDLNAQRTADELLGRTPDPPEPLTKRHLAELDRKATSLLTDLVKARGKRDGTELNER